MTRIDPFSPEQREAIKTEIKEEMRAEERRKRLRRFIVTAAIAVAAIGIPLLLVCVVMAKSGFVDVPVLSKALYKSTSPTRVVLPLYGSKPADIYRVIGTKVKVDPNTSLASVPLTEAELTTLAQNGVASTPKDSLPFPVKSIQVALDPDAVELFAISPQGRRDATVLVRFKPRVKDGKLYADVERIAIGSLEVPKGVGNAVFAAFGAIVNESVVKVAAQVGTLIRIDLEKGIVRFVILPKNH